MTLTPEQINTLISGILIIISGIVVGIITIIGGIINNKIQRNQDKIKFRKEIFEVRFTQVETFVSEIMVFCRTLNYGLLQSHTKENVKFELEVILNHLNANHHVLAGIRVSNDNDIDKAIKAFVLCIEGFDQNVLLYLASNSNKQLITVVNETYSLLEQAHVNLKESIDNFRLNDFSPKNKIENDKVHKKSP